MEKVRAEFWRSGRLGGQVAGFCGKRAEGDGRAAPILPILGNASKISNQKARFGDCPQSARGMLA